MSVVYFGFLKFEIILFNVGLGGSPLEIIVDI